MADRAQRPAPADEIRLALRELVDLPDEHGQIAETMETALGLLNLPRLEARLRDPPQPEPPPPNLSPQIEVARLADAGRREEAEALPVRLYGEVPDSWAGILSGSQRWRARPS